MKKWLLWVTVLGMLLNGCAAHSEPQKTQTYLDLFDTVTTVVGYTQTQEDFSRQAESIHDELLRYHQLFDIYNDYEGINNLKTVNDSAGICAVAVDPDIIRLLLQCKQIYTLTEGKVNVAMGSVLTLWHEARSAGLAEPEKAQLPEPDALEAAAAHTDMNAILIDEVNSTVYLSDPQMSLDVGAIAKGWAAQQVAQKAPEGLLISIGGNVCVTGPKQEEVPWVIGIQNPEAEGYARTLKISSGSVVTSGDYQRTYRVNGKEYHHIIDPDTRMPGTLWRSVSVVCADSALADGLSTALFLLPLEKGQALAESCGAQALWINEEGEMLTTPHFPES